MSLGKILWVDDEIESLQSQILFLKNKGYEVSAMTNGFDAIDFVKDNAIDVVLLDETMPSLTEIVIVLVPKRFAREEMVAVRLLPDPPKIILLTPGTVCSGSFKTFSANVVNSSVE